MLNSVGLQGPGVAAWLERRPARRCSPPAPRVVASIWGRTVAEYERGRAAARRRARRGGRRRGEPVVPEHRGGARPVRPLGRRHARGHGGHGGVRPAALGEAQPRTSPTSSPIADAARDGGAEAVTLVNTVLGMAIDPETGAYRLGSGRARRRAVRSGHPPGRRPRGPRRPRRPARPADRRRRRRGQRGRRRRAAAGRRLGRPGRHGHLRRPAGARPGARTSCEAWLARRTPRSIRDNVGAAHRKGEHRMTRHRSTAGGPRRTWPSPSTSTTPSPRCAWPASSGRGSAWPRSASSSTARRVPTSSGRSSTSATRCSAT